MHRNADYKDSQQWKYRALRHRQAVLLSKVLEQRQRYLLMPRASIRIYTAAINLHDTQPLLFTKNIWFLLKKTQSHLKCAKMAFDFCASFHDLVECIRISRMFCLQAISLHNKCFCLWLGWPNRLQDRFFLEFWRWIAIANSRINTIQMRFV